MTSRIFTLATTMALAGTASLASAQAPERLTPAQVAVACAQPPFLMLQPADAPRIVGSQDVVIRSTFGAPELLVINAGSARGIQINQQFYVRRLFRSAETLHDKVPHAVETAGWVRVVAVNAAMAIASPDPSVFRHARGRFPRAVHCAGADRRRNERLEEIALAHVGTQMGQGWRSPSPR